MLPRAALVEALQAFPLISLGGRWTRVVGYHLLQGPPPGSAPDSSPQPLWPGGPALSGARFTPKDSFGTIYLATDPITALQEVVAVFDNPHAPLGTLKTPPWAVFAVEGFVENILDLSDSSVVEKLDTSLAELTGDWRFSQQLYLDGMAPMPPTQLLGEAAYESNRILGLRYHSAKNLGLGSSLAIFADRLRPEQASFLEVYDPHDLLSQRLP